MDILRVNFNIGYVSQMSDLPILSSSLNLRNLFAIHPLLSYASGDQLSRINALPQVTSLVRTGYGMEWIWKIGNEFGDQSSTAATGTVHNCEAGVLGL